MHLRPKLGLQVEAQTPHLNLKRNHSNLGLGHVRTIQRVKAIGANDASLDLFNHFL